MKLDLTLYYRKIRRPFSKIVLEILPIEACISVVSARPVHKDHLAKTDHKEKPVLKDHKVYKAIKVYLDHKEKPDLKVQKAKPVHKVNKASKANPEIQ